MQRRQLLERRAQLDELAAALNRAASGTGVLVLVEAGAGLGKSALLSAAASEGRSRHRTGCGAAEVISESEGARLLPRLFGLAA